MGCAMSFHPARLATEKAVSRTALPSVFLPGIAGMKMKKLTYMEQLQHPNWQRKRLEVMNAAGFVCELCGDKDTMLQVHHRRYVKGRMAWEYEAGELQCLCKKCHGESHDSKDFFDRVFAQFHPSSTRTLAELLIGFGEEFVDQSMWIDLEDTRFARVGAIAWYACSLDDQEIIELQQFCMNYPPDCLIEAVRAYLNNRDA